MSAIRVLTQNMQWSRSSLLLEQYNFFFLQLKVASTFLELPKAVRTRDDSHLRTSLLEFVYVTFVIHNGEDRVALDLIFASPFLFL